MDFNECMSRRAMLKAAGAATVAAAAVGTSSARAGETATDQQWDEEHEFVIVGAGGAIFAAMAAQHEGADVIVLEKSGAYGGTTFYSHRGVWIPNNDLMDADLKAEESAEKALRYMTNCDLNKSHSPEMMADWIAKAPVLYRYLIDEIGVPIANGSVPNDYYSYDGWGRGRSVAFGNWYEEVSDAIDAANLDIRYNTPATELVTDGTGAVIGVVAQAEDGELRIGAHKGVLIATGSFDHNKDMRDHYLTVPLVGSMVPKVCTGDGHLMAMAIGADIANMDGVFGAMEYVPDGEFVNSDGSLVMTMGGKVFASRPANTIMVGPDGHRFCNESSSYDERARGLANMTFHTAGQPCYLSEHAVEILDSTAIETYGFPVTGSEEEMPSFFERFDTLEDLADGMGINKENLLNEVARFNGFCETGIDEDFHRGEMAFDNLECGVGTTQPDNPIVERPDLANPLLGPIEKAPFYAVRVGRGSIGTSGGLVVNENCQVLHNGEPIPGLYASGCAADSLVYGYPGGGFPVSMAVSRAVIAANHALNLGIFD